MHPPPQFRLRCQKLRPQPIAPRFPRYFVDGMQPADRAHPAFAAFKAAIDGVFRTIGSYHEQLTALITDHFRVIGAPKSQPP
jgi:hypothetical protein